MPITESWKVQGRHQQLTRHLEYPNGRSLEVVVARRLEPGMEFEMHGRRWQAIKSLRTPRNHRDEPTRILCKSVARVASFPSDPRD